MAEPVALMPLSAFAGLAAPRAGGARPGLHVAERRGLGLATVSLRNGSQAAFASRLKDAFAMPQKKHQPEEIVAKLRQV